MYRNTFITLVTIIPISLGSFSAAQAVCASYPHALTNGATADATQVMDNFNCAALLSGPSFTGDVSVNTAGGGWNGTSQLAVFVSNGTAVSGYAGGGSSAAFTARVDSLSGVTLFNAFYGLSNVGSITTNGSTTAYNTTSDERLKDWAIPQKSYAEIIRNIWVGDFKWKKTGQSDFGYRAQQAFSLLPAAVHKPADPDGIWQMDYGKTAPLALWGVKDLYKITDAQNERVSVIEQKMKSLTGELVSLRQLNAEQASQIHDFERKIRYQTAER